MSTSSKFRIEIAGSGEYDWQHTEALTATELRRFALESVHNFLQNPLDDREKIIVEHADGENQNRSIPPTRISVVEDSEKNLPNNQIIFPIDNNANRNFEIVESTERERQSLENKEPQNCENVESWKQQVGQPIDGSQQNSSCDIALCSDEHDFTSDTSNESSESDEIIAITPKVQVSRLRRGYTKTVRKSVETRRQEVEVQTETNRSEQNKQDYIQALELMPVNMVQKLDEKKTSAKNGPTDSACVDLSTGKENKSRKRKSLYSKSSVDETNQYKVELKDSPFQLRLLKITPANSERGIPSATKDKNEVYAGSNKNRSPRVSVTNVSNIENIIIDDSKKCTRNSARKRTKEAVECDRSNVKSNERIDDNTYENISIENHEERQNKRSVNRRSFAGLSRSNQKKRGSKNEDRETDDVINETLTGDETNYLIEDGCETDESDIKDVTIIKSASKRSITKRKIKDGTEFCSEDSDGSTPKMRKPRVSRNIVSYVENSDSDDKNLFDRFVNVDNFPANTNSPNAECRITRSMKRRVSSNKTPSKESGMNAITVTPKTLRTPKSLTRSMKDSPSNTSPSKEPDINDINSTPKTPRTPKSVRKLSKNIFRSPRVNPSASTPTSSIRNTPYKTPTTPRDKARWSLMLSEAPDSLPCREKEFAYIHKFISDNIRSKCGGFLCISGVPGTGKTATVERVLKKLRRESRTKGFNKFETVEINGMRLIRPQEIYRQIFKQLYGRVLSVKMAQESLNERFEMKKKQKKQVPVILVIDEFDCLLTKKHDVVYNIVEWQIQDGSQLTVLAIANTLDFFEKKKIFSRLKYDMISFTAYTFHDLKEIVCNRLKGNNMFSDEAVELVARKVAAISGDARRVLNLCSEILKMAPEKDGQMITITDVNKILEIIFSDPVIPRIRKLSDHMLRVLRATRDVLSRSGLSETSLYDGVWDQYEIICQLDGVTCRSTSQVVRYIPLLVSAGLLQMFGNRMTYCTKFTLNIEPDMIKLALSGKE